MESVRIEWEFDERMHRTGQALLQRAAKPRPRIVILLLTAATVAVVTALVGRVSSRAVDMIGAGIAGALVMLLVVLVIARRTERRALLERSDEGMGRAVVVMSDSGIIVENGAIRTEIGWSEWKRVVFEDGYFLFVARTGGGFYIPLQPADPRWAQAKGLVPPDLWLNRTSDPSRT